MADVLYSLPADQVADGATITVQTGTADSEYPVANLVDGNIANPAKLAETSGAWLFDFGSAQRVDWVALGPHNFDAGATVKIQGHATDSWGAPTVDTTITIPADDADGRAVCAWTDLTGVAGYSTSGFQYWRLAVTSTNSAALALGEVWLCALKRLLATDMGHNYRWAFDVGETRRVVEHQTEYGVSTVYDLQTRVRTFRADLRVSDTGLTAWQTWHRSMKGRVSPTVWIPDSSVNEAWWVRQALGWSVLRRFTNLNDLSFTLEELSHGLPL